MEIFLGGYRNCFVFVDFQIFCLTDCLESVVFLTKDVLDRVTSFGIWYKLFNIIVQQDKVHGNQIEGFRCANMIN